MKEDEGQESFHTKTANIGLTKVGFCDRDFRFLNFSFVISEARFCNFCPPVWSLMMEMVSASLCEKKVATSMKDTAKRDL